MAVDADTYTLTHVYMCHAFLIIKALTSRDYPMGSYMVTEKWCNVPVKDLVQFG